MYHKKYNLVIGMASLLMSIPSPTLLHEHFNSLLTNNSISILHTSFHGFEAQMLLIMMTVASIGLFAVAIRRLGSYIMSLGSYQISNRLDG